MYLIHLPVLCIHHNRKLIYFYFRSCSDIHYIPDVAGTLYTKQMNADTRTALLKASEKMKTLKEMCNKVLDDLKTTRKRTLEAIEKFRQELNDMLDKLELKTKKELDDQYESVQIQWQEVIEKGGALHRRWKSNWSNLKRVKVMPHSSLLLQR